jgi:hypothetical protein
MTVNRQSTGGAFHLVSFDGCVIRQRNEKNKKTDINHCVTTNYSTKSMVFFRFIFLETFGVVALFFKFSLPFAGWLAN